MVVFFFNDTATTEIYTLSLHDALPIFPEQCLGRQRPRSHEGHLAPHHVEQLRELVQGVAAQQTAERRRPALEVPDRKSTRLNSSHANISYAVFCLKKKNKIHNIV